MGSAPVLRPSGPKVLPEGETDPAKAVAPYAFVHECFKDGCTRWGSFGFGVALLRGEPGKWACNEHREELSALVSSKGKSRGEVSSPPPTEPKLL